jgi:hypothetical protein
VRDAQLVARICRRARGADALGVTAIHSEVHAIFDVQHVAMFEVAFGVLGEEASEDLAGGHKRTVPRPTSVRPAERRLSGWMRRTICA